MAWADKLPSGKYRGGYRVPGGQKRYTERTYAHKRAAERDAARLESEARDLGWKDPRAAARTWGDWHDTWVTARYVERSTASRDVSRITKWLLPKWRDWRLVDITRGDIKTWAAELKDAGLAPQSVKHTVSLFSTSLTAAVDAEVLPANPAIGLRLRFPRNDNERVLEQHEQHALFQAFAAPPHASPEQLAEATRDQAFLAVLIGAGPRWGEAVALQPHHINTRHREIRWRQAWDSQNRILVPHTKGKKRRTTPIAEWLMEIIAPQLERTPADGYLFANSAGQPLEYSNWRQRNWAPALERANLHDVPGDPVTIHTTRHTYATEQLEAGLSLAEIADLLGHSSISTTERYAHRRTKVSRDAATNIRDPRTAPPQPHQEPAELPSNVIAFGRR